MTDIAFYILAVFTLSLTGASRLRQSNKHLPEDCGINRYGNKVNRATGYSSLGRIIEGTETNIGEYPWIGRLGSARKYGKPFFYCSGSLVNRYYFISAAHCKDDGDLVRLGEHYLDSDPDCQKDICAPKHQDIEIESYAFNNYDTITDRNDISLIKLKHPASLNDFVQPICLPQKRFLRKALMGHMVKLSGWGSIHPTLGQEPNQLMHIAAPVVESRNCSLLFGRELIAGQICVGYDKGKDSCNGDSGGPVSLSQRMNKKRREVLLGIVSYGLEICGDGPAVYTDVSYYLNWLARNIKKS